MYPSDSNSTMPAQLLMRPVAASSHPVQICKSRRPGAAKKENVNYRKLHAAEQLTGHEEFVEQILHAERFSRSVSFRHRNRAQNLAALFCVCDDMQPRRFIDEVIAQEAC